MYNTLILGTKKISYNIIKNIDIIKKNIIPLLLITLSSYIPSCTSYPKTPFSVYKTKGNNVYYGKYKIPGADPKTFQILGDGYAKDMHKVYFINGNQIQIVHDADPESFQVLSGGFAKDKKSKYCLNYLGVQKINTTDNNDECIDKNPRIQEK